jgi:hypothetical protein
MEPLLELVGRLGERLDEAATLEALTRSASVSIREPDQAPTTLASTSDLVEELDRVQFDLREGPCYDVISGSDSTVITLMAPGSRWPRFGPEALPGHHHAAPAPGS